MSSQRTVDLKQKKSLIEHVPRHFPRHAVVLVSALFALVLGLALAMLALIVHSGGMFIVLNLIAFVVILGLVLVVYQLRQQQRGSADQIALLRTVNAFSQHLADSLYIEDVLRNIYSEVQRIVPLTTFYIALFDGENEVVEYRHVVHQGVVQTWGHQPLESERSVTQALRGRVPIRLNSNGRGSMAMGIAPVELPFATFLGMPLIADGQVIGILGLMHQTNANAFPPEEIHLLERVMPYCAAALRNARMFGTSTIMAQQLALINRSVQSVAFGLDSHSAIRAACETALTIARAQQVAVYVIDQTNRGELELFQQIGMSEDYRRSFAHLPYIAARYAHKPFLIPDVDEVTDVRLLEMARIGGFRAMAEIPLRSANGVIGLLVVYHRKPTPYSPVELELLDTLTLQITAAFDNAELLNALEVYAAEQSQLLHLSRITTSSLELEMVIASVAQILRQMLDVEGVLVGLLPGLGGHVLFDLYRAEPSTAYQPAKLHHTTLDYDELPEIASLIRQDIPLPRTFSRNDRAAYSRGLLNFMTEHNAASMMVLPLVVNTETLGVLFVCSSTNIQFVDAQRQLVEVATNQVATQLHNVQLFTRTREALKLRLEQLSLIEEIAQKISSELDFEHVIANVLEAALRSTQADAAELTLLNEGESMRVIGKELVDGSWHTYTRSQRRDEGILRRLAETRAPILLLDHRSAEGSGLLDQDSGGWRSSLTTPLLRDGRFRGALKVQSRRLAAFNDEQADFLSSLAGHAMISIQNARLMAERNANNNQMRAILDANRDGVILLDRDGNLLDANTAAELLLDLDVQEHVGENFAMLLLRRTNLQQHLSETEELTHLARILRLEPERITRRQYALQKHNHPVHIEEIGSPVLDAHHVMIGRLLVLRDITEEKRLSQFRDELTNLVIHDLRSPLGAIISSIMLAQETLKPEDYPTLAPVLNVSLGGGYALLNLVNSLLDISRWETEEIPLRRTAMSMPAIAREAVEMLAASTQSANITLRTDLPEDLPFVNADPDLIRRVLVNLLDNAIRYTPSNSAILIQAQCEPDYPNKLVVRVADSGPGIPPEEREAIFLKFKQVGSTPMRGHKGSGLGLTFCKLVIEGHGERIRVEDRSPLSGASIMFTLPLSVQ